MTVLGTRALNRALLARQFLLERAEMPALDAVRHLAGMQAQAPFSPYYGLWTRLAAFRPEELSNLLLDRAVARLACLRGTVHLVTADDALVLRAFTQPVMDADLRGNTTHTPKLTGVDLGELTALVGDVLAEGPLDYRKLGRRLAQRWPGVEPASLVFAARNTQPLVQVPPRAVWGRSGLPTYAVAHDYLDRTPVEHPDVEEIVLRYLGAFGPATVRDLQTWCGLTRLATVIDRLRPVLATFSDEAGRELFDLPGAPRPDPDVPAPARFLPDFDNLLVSHADRTRIISDDDRLRIRTRNAIHPGLFLVDGFAAGRWKLIRDKKHATLEIEPFRPLSRTDIHDLEDEGGRLLRFSEVDNGDVVVKTRS